MWGPDEFFYGDLYASRSTGCGARDSELGSATSTRACVGEELVREGAWDLSYLTLPDNDFHSHRFGPDATSVSIAKADVAFSRIVEAGGGMDAFLADNAVILTADHAQSDVEHGLPLADPLAGDWHVLRRRDHPTTPRSRSARPRAPRAWPSSSRAPATPPFTEHVRDHLRELEGVKPSPRLAREDGGPVSREGVGLGLDGDVRAVVVRDGHELSFRPGGQLRDERGAKWQLAGEPEALGADGRFWSATPGSTRTVSRACGPR